MYDGCLRNKIIKTLRLNGCEKRGMKEAKMGLSFLVWATGWMQPFIEIMRPRTRSNLGGGWGKGEGRE